MQNVDNITAARKHMELEMDLQRQILLMRRIQRMYTGIPYNSIARRLSRPAVAAGGRTPTVSPSRVHCDGTNAPVEGCGGTNAPVRGCGHRDVRPPGNNKRGGGDRATGGHGAPGDTGQSSKFWLGRKPVVKKTKRVESRNAKTDPVHTLQQTKRPIENERRRQAHKTSRKEISCLNFIKQERFSSRKATSKAIDRRTSSNIEKLVNGKCEVSEVNTSKSKARRSSPGCSRDMNRGPNEAVRYVAVKSMANAASGTALPVVIPRLAAGRCKSGGSADVRGRISKGFRGKRTPNVWSSPTTQTMICVGASRDEHISPEPLKCSTTQLSIVHLKTSDGTIHPIRARKTTPAINHVCSSTFATVSGMQSENTVDTSRMKTNDAVTKCVVGHQITTTATEKDTFRTKCNQMDGDRRTVELSDSNAISKVSPDIVINRQVTLGARESSVVNSGTSTATDTLVSDQDAVCQAPVSNSGSRTTDNNIHIYKQVAVDGLREISPVDSGKASLADTDVGWPLREPTSDPSRSTCKPSPLLTDPPSGTQKLAQLGSEDCLLARRVVHSTSSRETLVKTARQSTKQPVRLLPLRPQLLSSQIAVSSQAQPMLDDSFRLAKHTDISKDKARNSISTRGVADTATSCWRSMMVITVSFVITIRPVHYAIDLFGRTNNALRLWIMNREARLLAAVEARLRLICIEESSEKGH